MNCQGKGWRRSSGEGTSSGRWPPSPARGLEKGLNENLPQWLSIQGGVDESPFSGPLAGEGARRADEVPVLQLLQNRLGPRHVDAAFIFNVNRCHHAIVDGHGITL